MRIWIVAGLAVMGVLLAVPANAQFGGRLSVEPYVGYGFFGDLPDDAGKLEADIAFGGRVAYSLSPQWAAFGNFQRSTPTLEGSDQEFDVDHWSAGIEFSYIPRGGAEGMIPILLEAGVGQARYQGGSSDIAANIGLASAIQFTPNIAVRYGVNDYISDFAEMGIVNHIFARVGAEFTF